MTATQKDKNWQRLIRTGKRLAPRSTTPQLLANPKAVCELSGGDLREAKPLVVFERKHGVWFLMHWEQPLRQIDQWGDTAPAFQRMCRRLGYHYRWLTRFSGLTPGVH
jgi:hypothetical protein